MAQIVFHGYARLKASTQWRSSIERNHANRWRRCQRGSCSDHSGTRAGLDFGDLAPPIVVNEPRIATEHESPIVVSGTANVFEATVTY